MTIESDGHAAHLKQAGAQLDAQILSPADAKFELRDAQPLPTSPHPEGQAKNERIRKLAIHLTGVSDARLSVLLVPKLTNNEATGQTAKLCPLSEW